MQGSCDDVDLWLVRSEGVDYLTGAATNPGKSDNVTVLEFDCQTNSFPATFTWTTAGGQVGTNSSLHVHALGPEFGGFDIGDIDNDGIIDVVASTMGTQRTSAMLLYSINSHLQSNQDSILRTLHRLGSYCWRIEWRR